MQLNIAQQTAVETLNGPLLVLAGAGTGKTRVVTYRIAQLIKSGITPDRILAVTFTNKAAREMLERVNILLPKRNDKKKPEISTFHSLCVRILRRHIHLLGFPNLFSIYDRGDQESVVRQVLREVKVSSGALSPGYFLKKIGDWKTTGIRPENVQENALYARDYLCAVAYSRYQERLRNLGAVDFDDILLLTEDLFEQFPEVKEQEANRFDKILVDEYQDTNLCQYRIICGLAGKHRNLCVVGDDDQAIYGWRGAEVRHILNFKRDWPEAVTIRLVENYRTTEQIITWANRLIGFNSLRHPKKLCASKQGESPHIIQCKDGEVEAKRIVESIKQRLKGAKLHPKDVAILFRTNEQPRPFEIELRASKIPYNVVGGQSFFDRKEVKDVMAYLRVLVHPRDDVALLRIINTPPRHIGSTAIAKIRECATVNKKSIWDTLLSDLDTYGFLETKTQFAIKEFCTLLSKQAQKFKVDFSPQTVEFFLKQIRYQDEITRLYLDEEERKTRSNSVGEVIDAVAYYLKENCNGTLETFLVDSSLGGTDFRSQQDKRDRDDAVLLSTYHAAKGLEFQEVYMVGLEEGFLPHKRAIDEVSGDGVEEERRLCYVGITRAQKRLTLSLALTRMKRGKLMPTIPSRFLYEMTGQTENPRYLDTKLGKKRS